MEQRDLDSTYDPSLPWHIKILRGEEWHTIDTHGNAVQVIGALLGMPDISQVAVFHVPTGFGGTARNFIAEVNRRMKVND